MMAGMEGELPLLRSGVIPDGFPHGFSTRVGGVSAPPFDSLNLGGKWGDVVEAVSENRRRFFTAAGVHGRSIYQARQVHGVAVVRVRAGDDRGQVSRTDADGLCTDAPGLALGVFVADCIPALFADPRTGAVAAAHAGWRGTVAGVLPATVRALAGLGARPEDLRVALGPSIGPCCFEVGAEVVAAFAPAFPADVIRPSPKGKPDRWHIDLRAANRFLLERAGVPPAAIDDRPPCTSCERARFFSYRRDGAATGQMMGVIAALEGGAVRL
jgi:purine-nucleoside/S-methyl-5'-thioadenosine phosphorylase / adenosine deaminase